jgi:glycosyltransferase involved in cell wall biosynthesis
MKRRVVIVSGIQLINNPRAFKEAKYLSENGFDVTVLGSIYDADSLALTEEILQGTVFKHVVVFDGASSKLVEKVKVFTCRAVSKLARLFHSNFGWESPLQLGNQVIPLLLAARKHTADLFIVHLEQALYVGSELVDEGRNVAVDIEDWYSEDGLPEDSRQRPLGLIRQYERKLLQQCCYSSTTSKILGQNLGLHYQCLPPRTIFNTFPFRERELIDGQRKDRRDPALPSITWFSQTIGPGRGLEVLIEAVNLVDIELEVHIRGTPRLGFQEGLAAKVTEAKKGSLFFHPQVPQKQLLSRLAEHDIGFAGELSDCKSRDLTITNKAVEYMRAGLAVIASDTRGHSELAEGVEGFLLFQQNDPVQLAQTITELLSSPSKLADARKSNLALAQSRFCWEVESLGLLELVESATS